MAEVWREIPGYEGYYEASTLGRIRSVSRDAIGRWGTCQRRPTILSQTPNSNGYMQVRFSIHGQKSKPLAHRLIATTFLPNPDGLPQVNHKDGDKANNCAENLEWCTASDNAKHRVHVLGKQTGRAKRPVICVDTGTIYESSHHAARALGLNQGNILQVCNGEYNRAGGYHFKFAGGEINGR